MSLPILGRTAAAAVLCAGMGASGLFAAGAASANPLPLPMPRAKAVTLPALHANHPGPHIQYGAAAVLGGLALEAIAASATGASNGECTVIHRIVVDDDGNEYVRNRRVCD